MYSLRFAMKVLGFPLPIFHVLRKPFYWRKWAENRESTGMGLYLAKEICEKLGHELAITSEVGKGTIVTVTFTN